MRKDRKKIRKEYFYELMKNTHTSKGFCTGPHLSLATERAFMLYIMGVFVPLLLGNPDFTVALGTGFVFAAIGEICLIGENVILANKISKIEVNFPLECKEKDLTLEKRVEKTSSLEKTYTCSQKEALQEERKKLEQMQEEKKNASIQKKLK